VRVALFVAIGLLAALGASAVVAYRTLRADDPHAGRVKCVVVSSDNRIVLSIGEKNDARLSDVANLCRQRRSGVASCQLPIEPKLVALSHDGGYAVVADEHSVVLWTTASNKLNKRNLRGTVTALTMSAAAEFVVIATAGSVVEPSVLTLWKNTSDNTIDLPTRARDRGEVILTLSVSPDAHWLAVGGTNGTRLIDIQAPDFPARNVLPRAQTEFLGFAPDGKTFVETAGSYTSLWRTDTLERVWMRSGLPPLTFTSKGELLAWDGKNSYSVLSSDGLATITSGTIPGQPDRSAIAVSRTSDGVLAIEGMLNGRLLARPYP